MFLRYIISKIEECGTASNVVRIINILSAIRLVAQAWSKVKAETICKYFRKARVLDTTMDVVARGEEDDDPFLEADASLDLQGFIDKTMQGSQEKCMLEEYVTRDSDLADIHGENRQETFLQQIGQSETEEKGNEDDEEMNDDYPPMKVKTYQEAIRALEDVHHFLLSRGHMKETMDIGYSVDSIYNCFTS